MSRTAEDFLQEIAARPDDDALKGVYADWLLEQGDPRGEFIALQLKGQRSDEERSREATLIKQYADRWIPDEIFINLERTSLEFEKGLLAGCRFIGRSESSLQASIAHVVWSTVKRISSAPAVLIHSCPRIEQLVDVDEYTVEELAAKGRPFNALSVLGVHMSAHAPLERAFASSVFPAVRELRLGLTRGAPRPLSPAELLDEMVQDLRSGVRELEPDHLTWLFKSSVGRGLRRLVLHTGWVNLQQWLPMLARVEVPEVQLTPMLFGVIGNPNDWHVRFLATRPGEFRSVQIFPGAEMSAAFSEDPVRELLATAPRGYFEKLSLPEGLGWQSVRKLPCFERAELSRVLP
jgi:uncharacterized protein (TIGR02996 family)